jgi:hypothetical protein
MVNNPEPVTEPVEAFEASTEAVVRGEKEALLIHISLAVHSREHSEQRIADLIGEALGLGLSVDDIAAHMEVTEQDVLQWKSSGGAT